MHRIGDHKGMSLVVGVVREYVFHVWVGLRGDQSLSGSCIHVRQQHGLLGGGDWCKVSGSGLNGDVHVVVRGGGVGCEAVREVAGTGLE